MIATNKHEKRRLDWVYSYGRKGRHAGSIKDYRKGCFGKSLAEKRV